MDVKRILLLITLLVSCLCSFGIIRIDTTKTQEPIRSFYTSNSLDGAIFSTAAINNNNTNSLSTLRFSYFFNAGTTFNFNFDRHIGAFTGVDIKNVGFIEKNSGVTVKRRTYNIGVPVGIKFGNMARKGHYGFVGGGLDVPINYKEKTFTDRSHKAKFNEWFSDRVPTVMPYLFVGARLRQGLTLKLQYYPGNFLNSNFKDKNGVAAYTGYDVHLIYFSVGYTAPGGRKKGKKSIGLNDLQK